MPTGMYGKNVAFFSGPNGSERVRTGLNGVKVEKCVFSLEKLLSSFRNHKKPINKFISFPSSCKKHV